MENAETYEVSFYKRSLDNDNYIFTAPYYNSKSSRFRNITAGYFNVSGSFPYQMRSLAKDSSVTLHKERNLGLISIIKEKLGEIKQGHHNFSTTLVALCAQN